MTFCKRALPCYGVVCYDERFKSFLPHLRQTYYTENAEKNEYNNT